MKTTNKIETLLKTLNELNAGTYSEDSIHIKKIFRKNGYDADICVNNNKYSMSYEYGYDNEYCIYKIVDEFTDIYNYRNFSGITSEFIHTKIDNNKYNLYKYGISKNDDNMCKINDNELIKKIDENTYIGYNLNNHTIYIYFKKYNISNTSDNLCNDYIKYKYDESFKNEKLKYNLKLEKMISDLKKDMDDTIFKELIDTFNIRIFIKR